MGLTRTWLVVGLGAACLACADPKTPTDVSRSFVLPEETAASPTFTAVALGVLPGGTESYAFDINRQGDVAGYSDVAPRRPHPVVWSGSVARDLGLPTFGPYGGVATSINDAGTVAGFVYDEGFRSYGFLWNAGTFSKIAVNGGRRQVIEPWSVNNSEVVVGRYSLQAPPVQHAFRYTKAGGLIDLHPAGSGYLESGAVFISDGGVVVGWVNLAFEQHAAMWSATNVFTDLGTPGFRRTYATQVNNAGVIAGSADDTAAVSHPSIWRSATETQLIDRPGGATAISDLGRVAGFFFGPAFVPFTKKDSGPIALLPVLSGWADTTPQSVNACGTIVGGAFLVIGKWHAARWDISRCDQ